MVRRSLDGRQPCQLRQDRLTRLRLERAGTETAGCWSLRKYDFGMCRNIRPLYNLDPPATQAEVRDAALQYVRKISGTTKPSRVNTDAFERAVEAVADVSLGLLNELVTSAPARDREVEAARARQRAAARYAT